MDSLKLIAYTLVMAAVTYLIRMLPLVVFRKKIKSRFIRSFLYYIPYAVLAAMTIPAIFTSTANVYSAIAGLTVALVAAFFERSLITVAISSCVTVLIFETILKTVF
ncbi:MAG: AzlD domain-containing protein [Clostridia bacterium]|nr:AzlD domain-containing protein [Clostridia bacterium]